MRALGCSPAHAFVALMGLVGCGVATAPPSVQRSPIHMQVIRAMTTGERRQLILRLRERNLTCADGDWVVNEEALDSSLTVVDPFAGFLRRAHHVRANQPGGPAISDASAITKAREFVDRNADLLGIPRSVIPTLAERLRAHEPNDHVSADSRIVRFDAELPVKGFEGFYQVGGASALEEMTHRIELDVIVDVSGWVEGFVNLSRIQPHVMLDKKPRLAADDRRLLQMIEGRPLFVLVGAEAPPTLEGMRELQRIQLGALSPNDVTRVQLVIQVSAGPKLAWLTYRLAYLIDVAKEVPPALAFLRRAPQPSWLTGPTPGFFFFRYVVDADSGDVLEDARPPLVKVSPDLGTRD